MKTQENEEQLLWNELRGGDTIALGKLYDTYVTDLFSYGSTISEDRDYVMDCIHDLFLDLYKYRKKLSNTSNIKYYLLKSLKRKINRKYKQKLVHLPKNDTLEAHYNISGQILSPEEKFIAFERDSQKINIWQMTTGFLTKTQQKVLLLRFKEGRPYEEIAEIMDVSVETSRTIIYRAIKSLRKNMILPTLFVQGVFHLFFLI